MLLEFLEDFENEISSFGAQIIDYREKHGAFQSKKDLLNVKGIGDAKLNSIFDYITIGGMS